MTEVDWKRLLVLLLQCDLKGLINLARAAPGALVVPGLMGLTLAFPIVALFASLAMGGVTDFSMAALCAVLGCATLASFGPPRWPGPALSLLPHLPASDRAVYAHSIMRFLIFIPATAVYGLLPLVLTIGFLAPGFSERVVSLTVPVAFAVATAASAGRLGWGLVARWSAPAQLAARLALTGALLLPALTLLAGAPADVSRSMFGPLWALAGLGLSGVPLTTVSTYAAVLAMAGLCAAMAMVPVRVMPPHPTALAHAIRLAQADDTLRSGPLLRATPLQGRPQSPYPVPAGAERALRFLARQWLKIFFWIPLILVATGAFFAVLRSTIEFFEVDIEGPRLSAGQVSSVLYLGLVWVSAASSYHGSFEWRRASTASANAERAALPASLRVGPSLLAFKRWPLLQTLPLSRKTMERAFLRPLLALLVLACAAWAAFNVAGAPPGWIPWFAILYPVCVLLIGVGGFSIGRRSAKRHAVRRDAGLEALHSVFAGLWLASGVPLALVGPTGIQALQFPQMQHAGDGIIAFIVFAGAAIAMPAAAYIAARGRLVATTQPWESIARVAALGVGAVVFFVVPLALIASWLSPLF